MRRLCAAMFASTILTIFGFVPEARAITIALATEAGKYWQAETLYNFSVSRVGSNLFVSVDDGTTTLFFPTINDATFTSGRVGFHVTSQDTTFTNTQFNATLVDPAEIVGDWSEGENLTCPLPAGHSGGPARPKGSENVELRGP